MTVRLCRFPETFKTLDTDATGVVSLSFVQVCPTMQLVLCPHLSEGRDYGVGGSCNVIFHCSILGVIVYNHNAMKYVKTATGCRDDTHQNELALRPQTHKTIFY